MEQDLYDVMPDAFKPTSEYALNTWLWGLPLAVILTIGFLASAFFAAVVSEEYALAAISSGICLLLGCIMTQRIAFGCSVYVFAAVWVTTLWCWELGENKEWTTRIVAISFPALFAILTSAGWRDFRRSVRKIRELRASGVQNYQTSRITRCAAVVVAKPLMGVVLELASGERRTFTTKLSANDLVVGDIGLAYVEDRTFSSELRLFKRYIE